MFAKFLIIVITGLFGASEYEVCKTDGLSAKECVKKVASESEPVDYSKLNK